MASFFDSIFGDKEKNMPSAHEERYAWGGSQGAAQQYANNANLQANQVRSGIGTYNDQASQANSRNMRYGAGQQREALGLSRAAALGQAPSVAEIQQKQGLANSIAAQMGAANSSRGGPQSIAAAQRGAQLGAQNMQLQGNMQAAQLRADEMARARGEYLQGAGAFRGQSAQEAQWNAGQQNAMQQNNRMLALQDKIQSGQLARGYDQDALNTMDRYTQTEMARLGNRQGQVNNAYNRSDMFTTRAIGGVADGAGQAAAGAVSSDERAKTDIYDAARPIDRENPYDTPMMPQTNLVGNIAAHQAANAAGQDVIKQRQAEQNDYVPVEMANGGLMMIQKKYASDIEGKENAKRMKMAEDKTKEKRSALYGGIAGGLTSALGGMFLSDINTKTNVQGYGMPQGWTPGASTMGIPSSEEMKVGVIPAGGMGGSPTLVLANDAYGGGSTTMKNGQIVKPEAQYANFDIAGGQQAMQQAQRGGFQQGGGGPQPAGLMGRLFSDEEMKQGKQGGMVDDFLDTLAASKASYRYKDPSNEPRSEPTGGRYLGVMAQDLERIPGLGEQIVNDTPKGKVLEGNALMSAMAAAQGRTWEKLKELERKKGGK